MGTRKPSRPSRRSSTPKETGSAFFKAVRGGDLRRLKTLLNSHPELANAKTDDGTSAILVALYGGHVKSAEFLRAHGAVLSIYDAAASGDVRRVEELLAEDPRLIGFLSHDGWTPLHLAAFFGSREVVDFLLDHGADMHVVSKNENSAMPLHSALANNQVETATLLIDRGADIEARQTTYEYTPLHYAAAQGLTTVAQRLIDLGARTSAEGLDGKRPIDLAKEHGHKAIVEMLTQASLKGGAQ